VELSYRNQTLHALEEALVRKFAQASQLSLRQVMTPLGEVTAIDATESVATALELVRATAHSRLPMRDLAGRINGLLLFRDLIHARGDEPIDAYARTILLVSADMGIDEGIAALSDARASMAAVVDAADQPIGIVTLEDLLVPLVGDIADEHDEVVAA
jgi:CBS domain containing-hemolysin-like protein